MDADDVHEAARTGDVAALRRLAAAGAPLDGRRDARWDPDALFDANLTPLMAAAGSEESNAETVRVLLELGVDPKARCRAGVSALFYAAQGGDAERVRVLLAAGCDPAETTTNGHSVLSAAARSGDPERVRAILAAGARPDAREGERWSFEIPLFAAAESGSAECVRLLLDAGADPQRRERSGANALGAAGSAEVVAALVPAGLAVDAVDEHDRTPLDDAAAEARIEVMRALCAAGASLERRGRHIGETALHRLCRSFSVDPKAVEVMIALGADLFAVDTNSGGCALHHAAQLFTGDRFDLLAPVIAVLVRAGLPVDTRNRAGQTALFDAVGDEGGEVGAVRALLEHGADPNATDRRGYTPLMIASSGCSNAAEIVPLLLAAGADPRHRAADGRNAIDIARHQLGTWQSICAGDDADDPESRARHREAAAEADLVFDRVSRAGRR